MSHLILYRGSVNLRADASTDASVLLVIPPGSFAQCIAVRTVNSYRWFNVALDDGPVGWTREDVTFLIGDFSLWLLPIFQDVSQLAAQPATPSPVPVPTTHRWPAPVQPYLLTQGFGQHGHKGADLAGAIGTPVKPQNLNYTLVAQVKCRKCTQGTGSLNDAGVAYSAAIASDIAWGYGFGNFVTLKYAYAVLPPGLQALMKPTDFAYVLFGHLSSIAITGDQIGLRGNTGNSSGPHTHVEIHYGVNDASYFTLPLADPALLYAL